MLAFTMMFTKRHARAVKAHAKLEQTLQVSRETVAARKAAFNKARAEMRKAAADACQTAGSVISKLELVRSEAVLFLDYQGTVIHANQAAQNVLEVKADQLIGHSIEALLAAKEPTFKAVKACSEALFERFSTTKLSLIELTSIVFAQVETVKLFLNDKAASLPYRGRALIAHISLLETAPLKVEDITYTCRLSSMS